MGGLESSVLGSIMIMGGMIKTYVEGSEIIRGLGSNMKKYHSRPPPRESPGYTISNPLVVGGIIYIYTSPCFMLKAPYNMVSPSYTIWFMNPLTTSM